MVTRRATRPSVVGMVVVSLFALADGVINYLTPGNGINGTEGAMLVVISSLLLLIASIAIALRRGPHWALLLLDVLLALDFLGTAAAAYFLNAWLLLALMGLGTIAFIIHLFQPSLPLARVG